MTHQKKRQQRTLLILLCLIGPFWIAGALIAQQSSSPIPLNRVDSSNGSLFLTLKRATANELEQVLRQICGSQFVSESQYQYVFSVIRNNHRYQCSFRLDPQSNQIAFSGDKNLCDQLFLLITVIDQPSIQGRIRQIIPNKHTKPELFAQVFDACRSPQESVPVTPKPQFKRNPNVTNPLFLEFKSAETNLKPMGTLSPSNVVRLVDYQFEASPFEPAGIDPAVPLPGRSNMPGVLQPGDPATVNMVEGFQYRILPEYDVIVIEGDGSVVERFKEMVRQIEELSKIAEPKVEIIYLKHVNCVSLGLVFAQDNAQVYNDIFQKTQGAARIIPMVSPNAMLLIGWGNALETAKELVEALDKPIAVENSRLHIFKLKHISAEKARTVLAGAFPTPSPNWGPSGFMARIALFADARSNALIVQAAPNDLEEVKCILNEIDVSVSTHELQVQSFRLKHTLASDLAKVLNGVLIAGSTDGKFPSLELLIQGEEGQKLIKSGILSDAKIEPDVRNNTIIVRAPESCMAFVKELITLLDAASPEAEIKIFPIEHGDAKSLVDMLNKLIPSNIEGTPGPQLPGAAGEETLIPIRFAVEHRTNCIIAAGSPGDMRIVEALLLSLDREDLLSRKETVYFLKSMKADAVATALNEFIRARLELQQAAPGVISDYQQLESAVIVIPVNIPTTSTEGSIAYAGGNSLIISATPRYHDEIINLIKEIDKPPPQVVIRVLIAEVLLTDTCEWAAELGFQDPLLFKRTTTDAITGLATSGGLLFNTNPATSVGSGNVQPGSVGTQLLSNFGGGRVGTTGFSGMAFSASSDYINIMLRALQEKKRLEVLSSPQITTLNNQQAIISIGQKVPRYEGVSVSSTSTTPIIRDIDVSLMLLVQPIISPDGTIVMKVVAKNEKVGSESDGTLITTEGGREIRSPKIDNTNVATMVSAANNETVILGGLITKNEDKVRRKVPLLGDIPVIGKLFRQEYDQAQRKELLIILTPRIVDGQNDMEQIRQMEMARMSWCLNNVVQVYGDIGAYSVVSERPYTGDAPVIMPEPIKMEDLQPILAPALPTPVLPKK